MLQELQLKMFRMFFLVGGLFIQYLQCTKVVFCRFVQHLSNVITQSAEANISKYTGSYTNVV